MFQNIPKTRLLLYLLLIGLVPIVIASINFIGKQQQVSSMRQMVREMHEMAFIRDKKQAANMAVRAHFREVDHFYIDKYLETLNFLEPEVEGINKLLTNKNLVEDESIRKRLEYLTGPGNSMVFSEGVVQS